MFEDLAPSFEIAVSNRDLTTGVTQFVNRVSVETADGVAAMVKMNLSDPNNIMALASGAALVDSRVIGEGNELDVWMGYGPNLSHMGRYIIARSNPIFAEDDVPSVEVVAYTKDYLMMDNAPEDGASRRFPGQRIDDAIFEVSGRYSFVTDIDETPDIPWARIQKAGLSDYEFVKGLANMTGFVFWVDGDDKGNWCLHFRDPDQVLSGGVTGVSIQEKKFDFSWGFDDTSALLSFEPQLAVREARTKLKVQAKNPFTGALLEADIEEDLSAPDLQYEGDPRDTVTTSIPTAGTVHLFFGEFSVEVIPSKKFTNEDDLLAWAKQWFRRNRENFILASGRLIGVETLKARQVHSVSNVGNKFSGDYQFTRVAHIMSGDNGYTTEFNARKLVT